MNRCILITSHLNNEKKVNVSLDLIKSLKNKNIPIIFVGDYLIPLEIQKEVNYSFYISDSPKLKDRFLQYWVNIPDNTGLGNNLKRTTLVNDYGLAHLNQMYSGFKIAEFLGFDHVTHLSYDVVVLDEGWSVIDKNLHECGNIMFYFKPSYNSKSIAYDSNIFLFNVNEFIKMYEDHVHYYINLNPPNINYDFIFEEFIYWMILNHNVNHICLSNDNKNLFDVTISSTKIEFSKGNMSVYVHEEMDLIVVQTHDIPKDNVISFTFEDGNSYNLSPTNNIEFYTLPLLKGSFYENGNFLFNYSDIKNFKIEKT